MADNRHFYGFRKAVNLSGGGPPPVLEFNVASGYASAEGGGTAPVLSIGDPVVLTTDGTVIHAQDDGTADRILGVVMAVSNAKVDSNGKSRPFAFLPSGTAYTLDRDTSTVLVEPFGRSLWEIDVDDKVTATTKGAYQAFVGENCDFAYVAGQVNGQERVDPRLDISTHGTPTAHFRIMGISKTKENADFSGDNVKLLVQVNEGAEPVFTPVGD